MQNRTQIHEQLINLFIVYYVYRIFACYVLYPSRYRSICVSIQTFVDNSWVPIGPVRSCGHSSESIHISDWLLGVCVLWEGRSTTDGLSRQEIPSSIAPPTHLIFVVGKPLTEKMRWGCVSFDHKRFSNRINTYLAMCCVLWGGSSTADGCARASAVRERRKFVRSASWMFMCGRGDCCPLQFIGGWQSRWGDEGHVGWFRWVGVGFIVSYDGRKGWIRRRNIMGFFLMLGGREIGQTTLHKVNKSLTKIPSSQSNP
jgi:hypothetical protein